MWSFGFVGFRVPLKVWTAKHQPFTVFIECLNKAGEHFRILCAQPTVKPNTHVTRTGSKSGRSPRRSTSLEIQASKEVPGNLCWMVGVPKFDGLLVHQLSWNFV